MAQLRLLLYFLSIYLNDVSPLALASFSALTYEHDQCDVPSRILCNITQKYLYKLTKA